MEESLYGFLEYAFNEIHDDFVPCRRRTSERDEDMALWDERFANYLLTDGIQFLPTLYESELTNDDSTYADNVELWSDRSESDSSEIGLDTNSESGTTNLNLAGSFDLNSSFEELSWAAEDDDSSDDEYSEAELLPLPNADPDEIVSGQKEFDGETNDDDNQITSSDGYNSEPTLSMSNSTDSQDAELSDLGFSDPDFSNHASDSEGDHAGQTNISTQKRHNNVQLDKRKSHESPIFYYFVGIVFCILMSFLITTSPFPDRSHSPVAFHSRAPEFSFRPVSQRDRQVITESLMEASATLKCEAYSYQQYACEDVMIKGQNEKQDNATRYHGFEQDTELCSHLGRTNLALADISNEAHSNFSTALTTAWTKLDKTDFGIQLSLLPAMLHHPRRINLIERFTPHRIHRSIPQDHIENLVTGLEWYELALDYLEREDKSVTDQIQFFWMNVCGNTSGTATIKDDAVMPWLMESLEMRMACIFARTLYNSNNWLLKTVGRDSMRMVPQRREIAERIRIGFYQGKEAGEDDSEFMTRVSAEIASLTKVVLAETQKYANARIRGALVLGIWEWIWRPEGKDSCERSQD